MKESQKRRAESPHVLSLQSAAQVVSHTHLQIAIQCFISACQIPFPV